MATSLHQLSAAIYLIAGVVAGVGLALRSQRLEKAGVWVCAAGALLHGVSFLLMHGEPGAPPLTELAVAISFMAWMGTLSFLLLQLRMKLAGMVVLVAPLAFLGVFVGALRLPVTNPGALEASGSWPHAHVLLASAGLSLLGVAGMAGLLFLFEYRRLKSGRALAPALPLPSLEGLDRVNVLSLVVGFSLLTLGVITGMIWQSSVSGRPWSGTPHETWCAVAWAVYAVLVSARFGASQGARQAAASALGGFAFLLFAVVGVGFFA